MCPDGWEDAPPSNEVLQFKAKDFAECLLELVTRMGPTFYTALVDEVSDKEEILWAIQLELVFLCLFLTDVVMFMSHGAEKRKVFMDVLGVEVRDLLIKELRQESAAEAFGVGFFESLNHRQIKYSRYRDLIPGEGESLEDTLCWEFGKGMAALYGNNNPVAVTLVSDAALGMYEPIVRVLRILEAVPPPEGKAFYDRLSEEDEASFQERPYEPLLKLKSTWPPARKFDK